MSRESLPTPPLPITARPAPAHSQARRAAADPTVMKLSEQPRRFERYQQSRRWLSFPLAVLKKFSDDQASQLAALVAYYGFLSIFPLLLVFVTILGFVLQGNPAAQHSVLHSTLSEFPIIGVQLERNVRSLKGSGLGLAIGLIASVLAGLGITGAAQNAFNQVWHVPHKHRPNFALQRLRGLGLLAVLGSLMVLSTAAAGYVTAQTHGALALAGVLAGVLVALAANLLLFFTAFRLLTVEEVHTRDLLPGVILATVCWQLLQYIGGYYVDHVIRRAQETSGFFALVLGLLAWLYLGSQVTLLAAEVNVVRARRLWPRSLFGGPLTSADERSLRSSAEVEERLEQEDVQVSFRRRR